MVQKLDTLVETASQTAGPYVHIGCMPTYAGNAGAYDVETGAEGPALEGAKGEVIEITGEVLDGMGWALRDVMLECWQADAAGIYPHQEGADPKVTGFARIGADFDTGKFTLKTIKPGAVAARVGGKQAPHISLWLTARGINIGLQTRVYFEDEDNAEDPLLNRIEQAPRRQTLIAKKTGDGTYTFNIVLQGEGETVFLDL